MLNMTVDHSFNVLVSQIKYLVKNKEQFLEETKNDESKKELQNQISHMDLLATNYTISKLLNLKTGVLETRFQKLFRVFKSIHDSTVQKESNLYYHLEQIYKTLKIINHGNEQDNAPLIAQKLEIQSNFLLTY